MNSQFVLSSLRWKQTMLSECCLLKSQLPNAWLLDYTVNLSRETEIASSPPLMLLGLST